MDSNKIKPTIVSRVLKYFTPVTNQKDQYMCNFCGKNINGKQPSNLTTHLKRSHKDIYDTKICINKNYAAKRLKLLQLCVEKVTINKEPFKNILKSAFQKLIAKKLDKLNAAGHSLNLTDKNLPEVKNHIRETASKIRDCIASEVKGRMISVMVDIASKFSRSVLGISIQYIKDGKHTIRTIVLIELTERHNADYIAELIYECLLSYKIEISQVVSLTTDNAANMLATVKRLNEIFESSDSNQEEEEEEEEPLDKEEFIPDNLNAIEIPDESYEDELYQVLHQADAQDQEVLNDLIDDSDEHMSA